MAWPALLARTKDWGTEILTDSDLEGQLDLTVDYINDALDASTGHKHDGTTSEGPKLLTSNLNDVAGTQGDIIINADGSALGRLAVGAADTILTSDGTDPSYTATLPSSAVPDGSVLQLVYTLSQEDSTGTTAIPADDTVPLATEGDQFMTRAITPNAATNLLKIDVTLMGGSSGGHAKAMLLDGDDNVVMVNSQDDGGSNQAVTIAFTFVAVAGGTSAQTWKVRAGGDSGTFTFNGKSGTGLYGGKAGSSIVITEIKAS